VLVVDDESIIRNFLADGLTDAGYHVITAHDGAEALDSVYRYQPDAVLLDLLMPVVDGWAFLRERRVQPALAAVPVVVFSAAGKEGLHDAAALRANAVLPKPLDLDVLSAVLEYVLSDARKDRADAAAAALAATAGGDMSVRGGVSAGRQVGTCPICGIALFAHIDDSLPVPARIRAIHAVRRAHVMSHSAGDIARVPLRTRLFQMPTGQRRILADWVYRELRQQWGDTDRHSVHTVDETLGSVAMHRLWQDAIRCSFQHCAHDQ
jgi:CheY-like chemotaxis protein